MLLLSYLPTYPKALEYELKNSTKWAETESNQDVAALLQMIREITHSKKVRKESVITIVKNNVEIFAITQGPGESLNDYCKVFRAQIDTIGAHGDNAGYHLVVYKQHLAALTKKKKTNSDDNEELKPEDKRSCKRRQRRLPRRPACLARMSLPDDGRRGALQRGQDGPTRKLLAGQEGLP